MATRNLRGRRVLLQEPEVADRDEFLALVRASRRFHRGWASPPSTPERFAAYIVGAQQPNRVTCLVRQRADAALAGAVELSQIVHGAFRSAYLGYWIGAPYAGQGLMTDAVAVMLRHAFGALRLHRVEANVQPENERSLALVRRLGFVQEGYSRRYLRIAGRWRDHERWALLVEDWRSGNASGRAGARVS